jgi:hypothetical protein
MTYFIGRRDDNSIYGIWTVRQFDGQEELADDDQEVLAFRAPRPPIDRSDLDLIDKQFKALALCVAQGDGLTPAQMKVRYKQKWDSLP